MKRKGVKRGTPTDMEKGVTAATAKAVTVTLQMMKKPMRLITALRGFLAGKS